MKQFGPLLPFLVRDDGDELGLRRSADQEDARLGQGDRLWGIPREGWESVGGCVLLRGTDQEGEAPSGNEERGGDPERVFEALDGAEGHDVEASMGAGEIFGAAVEYIDVRQCKRAGCLAEERGLLVVGFYEREIDVRIPELEGDAGKSGARTDIGDGNPLVDAFAPLVTGKRWAVMRLLITFYTRRGFLSPLRGLLFGWG